MEWLTAEQYTVARDLMGRAIGAIYVLAFLNVLDEWRPLAGERGLLPVTRHLDRLDPRRAPSIFHWRYSDRMATGLAWVGLLLSASLVAGVPQSGPLWLTMLVWAVLWGLYLSYVTVGQIWYAFGWESILLEAGFLAIFLGNDATAPLWPVILLFRWLAFRIELGAGLIKMRGDRCWRELTCLDYHHETQPLPSLFSWYFHHLPRPLHRVETAANHVAQLVMPFGLFLPQPVAGVAGLAMVVTQGWLVISGNFSWLNALTIVVAVSAISDAWLDWLPLGGVDLSAPPLWFLGVVGAVTLATAVMSWWPVRNMLSRDQRMNASYNPFHLVNTYGAFGSVTRTRYEIVVEGTADPSPGPGSEWREYGFRAKPTDPARRPPQIAPYHLRLDWLLWFAAMSPQPRGHPWFPRLLVALLEGDDQVRRLLRRDPFPDGPPHHVRARRFRYRFSTRQERRETGDWWVRDEVGTYVAPLSLDDVTGARRRSGSRA